jgi:uncharacterized membrane protein
VWPLAVLDYVREPIDATAWSRLHTRQALVFGVLATFGYLVVLALPLLIVLVVPAASTTLVVWLYLVGIVADVAAAVYLFARALGYRQRALRGELFSIPLVTPIADRLARAGS